MHAWQIGGHVLGARPSIGESDAAAFAGRTIDISPTTYASPFHGTCNDAAHSRRDRALVDIANESELDGAARAKLIAQGFTGPVTEYRMSCSDRRVLALVLVVKGDHAFTCFSDVCYLLRAGPTRASP